jgi:Secretion system C-terminal sorting domain
VNCGDAVVFTDPTPTDACDQSVSFSVLSTSSTTNSDGSVDSCTTWQAVDDCGNSAECTQCIHINPCATLFCSYTQGFWGNSGGHDCYGNSKPQLINDLLSTPLVIGCNGNTMTFGIGEGQCVIDRLPGGGPSVAITGNNTCNSIVGIALHSGTPARFRNTLLAQTIALELNVRYDVNLGGVQITGQYMTTQDASPCDSTNAAPSGSPSVQTIPQSVITYLGSNNTVNDLLQLANDALCGAYVPSAGNPTLSDITKALDAFNQGFDECRFLLGFSNTLRNGAVVNTPASEDAISVLAYPNPFNSNTNITFSVSAASADVKVEVFNSIGEHVATLFHGAVEGGVMYTVEFNGTNIPAGIYTYRIISGNESYVDKLTLIK